MLLYKTGECIALAKWQHRQRLLVMKERIWKNRAVIVCHFTVGLNGAFVQQSAAGKT